MAATDGQIVLAASRFGDTPSMYLRDFAKTELPAVAKIIKGQHLNLGVPTLSNPSLQSTALFLNAGKKYQILAQPIKIKEGRKTTNVGPKVLIPETYPGFFELLSEDGRSTRCIENVLELSRRRNLRVLVRETIRCNNNSKTLHAGEIITTILDNGKYLQCKTNKDEIVNLPLEAKAKFSPIAKEDSISGVHTVKNLLQKRMPVIVRLVHGSAPKGLKTPFVPELRLLGCIEVDRVFALPLQKDSDLISVPLNAKLKLQRAKNMEQLENFIEYSRFLDKAQRLLQDARDRLQVIDLKLSEKDGKNSKDSTNNIKYGLNTNGYVLRKSASCDSTSTAKYSYSSNGSIAEEYDEIDQIYDYVRGFAPLPKNLNKFEPIPEPASHHNNNNNTNNNNLNNNSNSNNVSNNNTSSSHNNNTNKSNDRKSSASHHLDSNGNYTNLLKTSASANNIENLKTTPYHHHHHHHIHPMPEEKPIPPPIETIPTKKQPEKRQRPTLPKLYVKNNILGNNSIHHQKISSPLIMHSNGKESIEPQSPLFHIRYKSLSSLQLTPESNTPTPLTPQILNGSPSPIITHIAHTPTQLHHTTTAIITPKFQDKNYQLKKSSSTGTREGTLDSSRSGGRTSGDSNSKLPEKKTRRLSRPRSLSNLVWECRQKDKSSKKKFYVHHDRQQGTLYL